MKKIFIFISIFLFYRGIVSAQQFHIDSLNNLIKEVNLTQNDTAKLIRLTTIGRIYSELNPDSSFHFSEQALTLARQLHLSLDEADALREMGYALLNKGNYPRALQTLLSAVAIAEDSKNEQNVLVGKFAGDDELRHRSALPHAQRLGEIAFAYQELGILYANSNNYEKALQYHLLGLQNARAAGNIIVESILCNTINRVYLNLKKIDSAFSSIKLAYDKTIQSGYKRYFGSVLLNTGRTYAAMGDTPTANEYYRKCLTASAEQGYYRGLVAANLLLADYYTETRKKDSAFAYITNAFSAAQKMNSPDLSLRVYSALSRYYSSGGKNDSTVKYQALIIKINDSLFNVKQAQQFQNIDFDEQQRKQEIQATDKEYRNRLNIYLLLAGLVILVIISGGLWRRNIFKQKAYTLLQNQKQEIDFQKSKAEKALRELKSAQLQLIQSEKMASLGELTAGIAHEIQNPLNFVNNFSEVNTELIDELRQEADKGNIGEIKAIANNIKENEKKINYHGKRADVIVKGMLQHSRISTGQKEPTDLNRLIDEYLRISYQGQRIKDSSFNSKMETNFDPMITRVDIIPREIGRVLLNLFNNAFYTVSEKKKQQSEGYEPIVTVNTVKTNDGVEIKVRDNGNGIPKKILDKIFQPFFTTKPTGQGTGLGLSLSYDIIKAHGGEIRVDTEEGKFSEFTIVLPS